MLLTKMYLKHRNVDKSKWMEKDKQCNTNQKKFNRATLMSKTVDFKARSAARNKER